MNIVARLIGVGTFAYFLVMFCLLIVYTNISVRSLLRWYTAALTVMGFFYEPYITSDLYRIREMMVTFSAMELPAFIRTYVVTSATPVARLLYWAVGKTGVLGLLPALAALVSYGSAFHILEDAGRRLGSSRRDIMMAMLFVMAAGQYMYAVSNIRTMMAMSLIVLCLYRETVQKKSFVRDLPLYAAAMLMHTIAIPVIAIRVVLPVFSRKTALWKRILMFILGLTAGAAVLLLVPNLANELVEKIDDYIFGDRYSYIWEYIIASMALCVEVYILYLYKRRVKPEDDVLRLGAISRMLILCILMAVVFCFEFSIFHRLLTYIAPLLVMPLMLAAFRGDAEPERMENRRTLILVVSLCMLALACSRGSLCSFKFY